MPHRHQPHMFPTRAEQIGVKPKVLRARTLKSLAYHRSGLERLAMPYTDIDNSLESALQDLLQAFDIFQTRVIETADWLNDPPE